METTCEVERRTDLLATVAIGVIVGMDWLGCGGNLEAICLTGQRATTGRSLLAETFRRCEGRLVLFLD